MTDFVVMYVVNAAIQTTLVPAVTLAATRALRGAPARIRFMLVAVAIAIAAIVPAVTPRFAPVGRPGFSPAAGLKPGLPATGIALVFVIGASGAIVRLVVAAA